MTEALTACSPKFEQADVKLSFAGSDELAAQIRQGVKPDVYAAANTKLPDELYGDDLLSKPVEFATNTFVLAVPKGSEIDSHRRPHRERREDRDRLGVGADRLLHARDARRSCRPRRRRRSSPTCAPTSPT